MKNIIKKILAYGVYIKRHFKSPSDVIYHVFFKRVGYYPNFNNPKTFNEKLQWLKLNNHNPLYTKLVDKAEVKYYVSSIIGDEYIIPTLGLWDRFEDIDFSKLPDQFVLKCTHDSGGLVICKDKHKLDFVSAKQKIKKSLSTNYYYLGYEWPYKNVKPRIIAEQFMEDSKTGEMRDYKFYVFNGKAKILKLATDRDVNSGEVNMDFYDMDFNHLPFRRGHPNSPKSLEKPSQFQLMKTLAEKLASNIPFVRVDFYEVNGKVYFGEMTFFPASGWVAFDPQEWDYTLGSWLELPKCTTSI